MVGRLEVRVWSRRLAVIRRRSGRRIESLWARVGRGGEWKEQEAKPRATSRWAIATAMPQSWSFCWSATVEEKVSERVQGGEGESLESRERKGR